MAINPSKLLRLKPVRATISASSLKGSLAPVGPKITASKISSSSIVANKHIIDIQNSLADIIGILTVQNKTLKDAAEKARKSEEAKRRAGVEENLEKRTDSLSKATEKVLSPVKSLLDKIIDFILAVFIGRSLVKLIRWFGDPENKTKVRSIFRFLGDHWPKLLALYLRFGTGLGRFIGGLSSLMIRGTLRIAQAAAGLAARAGLKGAGRVASFLGGRYGKALAVGLEVGTTIAGTMALSKGIEDFGGLDNQKTKTPMFRGGGLANFSKLFKFSGGSYVPGFVSGQKGVDKIPAMLSDGEFVMSSGAVQKYGVDTLMAMNAAGGGTNRPKISSGTTYAAGGGLVGMMHNVGKFITQGSGTVMAPGGKEGDIGYQTKLLGINIGSRTSIPLSQTYKQGDVDRYNAMRASTGASDRLVKDYYGRHFSYTDPNIRSRAAVSPTPAPRTAPTPTGPFTQEQKREASLRSAIKLNRDLEKIFRVIPFASGYADTLKRSADLGEQELKNQLEMQRQINMLGFQGSVPRSTDFGSQTQQTSSPLPRFSGGLAPQSTSKSTTTPMTISASTAKSRNASKVSVSPPISFMPEVVYEVMQPTASSVPAAASGTPQVPSFPVAYAGGNANKNATIYGIG